MWLLPRWCPFHPCRMWCHARMVYLPMGYLWGSRWVYADCEVDETVLSLRRELYPESYEKIDWRASRSLVAPIDDYSPVGVPMRAAQLLLRCYGELQRSVETTNPRRSCAAKYKNPGSRSSLFLAKPCAQVPDRGVVAGWHAGAQGRALVLQRGDEVRAVGADASNQRSLRIV